ncbi:LysR family transcriptional regulator [Ramlibacter sp.]|uniref:LysR family transcriptional regulator n=1 Tax=Ramlibacter sp. TaxID=1917967 RepID=UPI001844CF25|nr:LysR family transcriptional regulator [Ramlibacter sp.]MBA2673730.1 LysR family transcriptional regulator [Ramlibacter sp.]
MQFTLKQVEYFLAAAEAGQFTSAAARVHVTQSAMTAAIRELEASLGCRLFERRHASGVTLTLQGQRFLEHARHIASAVAAAGVDAGGAGPALEGTVKLLASSSVLGYYLVPALARFAAAFPLVRLVVEETARPQAEAAVAAGRADLAVLRLNPKPPAGVEALVLTRSRRQLWLGAGHPLLAKRQVTLADIARQPYILYDVDEMGGTTREIFARRRLAPDIRFRVTSIEAVRSLVAQGLGVTVLSDVAYRPSAREGARVETRPLDALAPVDIALLWSARRKPGAAAEALSRFLQSTFGAPNWSAPAP